MNIPRQIIHKLLGESGCYFLSIILWAERMTQQTFNDVVVYEVALEKGWMERDGWMIYPERLLGYLVGGLWTVKHTEPNYVCEPNEIAIERWGWKRTMVELAHFKPPFTDPYGFSETVKNGELVSLRVFRRTM